MMKILPIPQVVLHVLFESTERGEIWPSFCVVGRSRGLLELIWALGLGFDFGVGYGLLRVSH